METEPTSAIVVLIHGAWHGAWCWDRVVPQLETAGVPTVAVDLPGHGASTEPLGDLYTHAAFVRDLLDGIDGPIVLCGHSYGGAVISEAAAGVDSVCVHGDSPGAVRTAIAVRHALEAAGLTVATCWSSTA